jgi:hypothetical protein
MIVASFVLGLAFGSWAGLGTAVVLLVMGWFQPAGEQRHQLLGRRRSYVPIGAAAGPAVAIVALLGTWVLRGRTLGATSDADVRLSTRVVS